MASAWCRAEQPKFSSAQPLNELNNCAEGRSYLHGVHQMDAKNDNPHEISYEQQLKKNTLRNLFTSPTRRNIYRSSQLFFFAQWHFEVDDARHVLIDVSPSSRHIPVEVQLLETTLKLAPGNAIGILDTGRHGFWAPTNTIVTGDML